MDNHLLRNIGNFTRSIQYLCDVKYRDLNLQKGQFMFLMRICEHPGISQKNLSQLISVEKSTTTRAIQKLEKDGYIYREKNSKDSRSFSVYPTAQGLMTYPELARYELQLNKSVTSKLSKEEGLIMTRLFNELQETTMNDLHADIDSKTHLDIVQATSKDTLDACFSIREEVFQRGQNVPKDIDFDGRDSDAYNFIAYFNQEPAATCRLRPLSDSLLKFERLAVLSQYRNLSIASAIIEYGSVFAKSKGYSQIKLHAQMSALNIYLRAGYKAEGETFYEANIEHVLVTKHL